MSDQVVFHTGNDQSLEEARKELATAEAALAAIGKKGLLERQSTHDKKIADAQAAIDAAKAKIAQLSGAASASETKAVDAAAPATSAVAAGSSNSSVEAAAERIRKLKAENAPQVEVRAAVEAHALEQANALKAANAPQAEVKAAVLNYIALTEDPLILTPIEVAKKKVRMLKANEASQDEVRAAVEAYIALAGAEAKTQTPAAATQETKTEARAAQTQTSTPAPTTAAPQSAGQATTVEEAAERVRSLKAAKAPQAEVKAAVEAYIALTQGGSRAESKASVVAVQQTPVEAAAEKIRQLKAARAPQPEVKAAVEAYLALMQPGGAASAGTSAPAGTSAQASAPVAEVKAESKASSDLEAAGERVRSLKAAKAPQAEVKAAVEAYIIEEAKDKVQKLKAARAPQAEVRAAVEAYIALTEPAQPAAATTATGSATEATTATGSATEAAEEDAPAVRMHLTE